MPESTESVDDAATYAERVTRRWIRDFVVDLNLCPFARSELEGGRLHVIVTAVQNEAALLQVLDEALSLLVAHPEIETAILVHPQVLQDFDAYLDFLSLAELLLTERGDKGIVQIASFHPDYCFEGAGIDDAANFSNRSPYPMLHLLRESSVTDAVERHPDAAVIPERNVATLRERGTKVLDRSWRECFDER